MAKTFFLSEHLTSKIALFKVFSYTKIIAELYLLQVVETVL